MQISVVIPLSV